MFTDTFHGIGRIVRWSWVAGRMTPEHCPSLRTVMEEISGQCGMEEISGHCGMEEISGQCGIEEISGQCQDEGDIRSVRG